MNAQTKIETEPLTQLICALAKALPELEGVSKNKENAAFKNGGKASKYADLGAVIDAVRPVAEHGIWYRQRTHESPEGVMVETIYMGFGAELSAGALFMPASKKDAQGFGSALTYCRRYSLQTAFGLSADDDDGNAASKRGAGTSVAIDDSQWAMLAQLIESTNTDTAAFCKAYSIDNLRALPAATYEDAKAQLNRKLAKLAKETVDA